MREIIVPGERICKWKSNSSRGFEKLIFKQKIKFQLIVKSKINTNIIGLKPINCN